VLKAEHDVFGRGGVHGPRDGLVVGLRSAGEHFSQRAGEYVSVVVGYQDPVADLGAVDRIQTRPAPCRVRLDEAPQRLDNGGRLGRSGAHDCGHPTRCDPHARRRIMQHSRRCRAVRVSNV